MNEERPSTWRVRSRLLDMSTPLIVGILNVTPDSFSDAGEHLSSEKAVAHASALLDAGAHVIDVGGESTRPGAASVTVEVEVQRVLPVIERLARQGVVVSIDTMKPQVADVALTAGAEIVNDVGGFRDSDMRHVAARHGAGVVIVHMQGSPRTMQKDPSYNEVVAEVAAYLGSRAELCVAEGVAPDSIVVDPGIGFGKTMEHNLELLSRLDEIVGLGFPVLVGTSRKSFLGKLLGLPEPHDRDLATAITTALAVERGAAAVRVHDPASSRDAAVLARAIVDAGADRPQRLT